MKKVVLNISDSIYEKLRFEAVYSKKSISCVIQERLFYKPFSDDIEEAFEKLMIEELNKIMSE